MCKSCLRPNFHFRKCPMEIFHTSLQMRHLRSLGLGMVKFWLSQNNKLWVHLIGWSFAMVLQFCVHPPWRRNHICHPCFLHFSFQCNAIVLRSRRPPRHNCHRVRATLLSSYGQNGLIPVTLLLTSLLLKSTYVTHACWPSAWPAKSWT